MIKIQNDKVHSLTSAWKTLKITVSCFKSELFHGTRITLKTKPPTLLPKTPEQSGIVRNEMMPTSFKGFTSDLAIKFTNDGFRHRILLLQTMTWVRNIHVTKWSTSYAGTDSVYQKDSLVWFTRLKH